MRSTMKGLTVIALVAGAFGLTSVVAAEVPIQDEGTERYRDTMSYFVPELGKWAAELQTTIDALQVKPELASSLPELAYRGKFMVYDLEGTTPPAEMVDAHESLIFALGQLTEVAQIAADDSAGAQLLMDNYYDRMTDARRDIRRWLMTNVEIVEPGEAPAVLVAGQ